MAPRDRRDWELDTGELIKESGRQVRQSRDLINHLDQALARSERLLKRQPGRAGAEVNDLAAVAEDVPGAAAAT